MTQNFKTTGYIVKPGMESHIGVEARSTVRWPRTNIGDVQSVVTPCLMEKPYTPIHRLSLSDGGRDNEENLVHLHHTCHRYLHNNEDVVLIGQRLERLDGTTVTSRS